MPVYLFTFHAYRSWNADDRRGYVRKNADWREADPEMARHYNKAAKAPPARFDTKIQQALLDFFFDACKRRDWWLYGFAGETTHVHLLVGWSDERIGFDYVRNRLRNLASRWLNQNYGKGRWFSRGSSRKRVKYRKHFDHLLGRYLPKHQGVVWVYLSDAVPSTPDLTPAENSDA
jgi:REP element-mobilizing transposase RayT